LSGAENYKFELGGSCEHKNHDLELEVKVG
jgi:hypothetical protein